MPKTDPFDNYSDEYDNWFCICHDADYRICECPVVGNLAKKPYGKQVAAISFYGHLEPFSPFIF